MARGVNKVIVIGHVGQDPEMKQLPSGNAVCNFSLATTEKWKDKQTGEQKEATEWHPCSAFGRLAEIIGEYVRKGSQIYVEGKLRTRKWQDKTGNDRYKTEIIVDELRLLNSKGESPRTERAAPAPKVAPADEPFHDDDIPF